METIGSVRDNPAGTPATAARRDLFAGDFQSFLKLLTTQLEQQDPLSPMNAEKFTQQLVQFTTVEQALRANERLDTLIDTIRAGQVLSAAAYVGREVELAGDEIFLPAAGDARFGYLLPREAASVQLVVRDVSGRVVHEEMLDGSPGRHLVSWDGRDDAGRRLEPGRYRLELAAKDGAGVPVEVELRTVGTVQSVRFDDGELLLVVDGTPHPLSTVLAISPGSPTDA